jgi:hypothetical protein
MALSQARLTMHIASTYIDKLLKQLAPNALEDLTAVTCLLLAAKLNEIDDNIPLISEMSQAYAMFSQHKLTPDEIIQREIELTAQFDWDL